MMTGLIQDQNLEKQIEKQIGCMSGFLHIFDRQQILAGKRVYSAKRLHPSTVAAGSPESDKSARSVKLTAVRETEKPVVSVPESPDRLQKSPTPPRSPLPLPIFEMKEGSTKASWKLCKEMPRLSLDSRATLDSKGSLCAKAIPIPAVNCDEQRPSPPPGVIARLMGLDQLPSSTPESVKKPVLRRSASESRVSRDLFHSRFAECNNKNNNQVNKKSVETNLITVVVGDKATNNIRNAQNGRLVDSTGNLPTNQKQHEQVPKAFQWGLPNQRRSFFNSGDIFPEPKQTVYGDSDKCFKLRGIDEQTKDLQTLKHILEALQFKGLLHSNRPLTRERNLVYEPNFLPDDQNMVPRRSPAPNRRFVGNDRYSGEVSISPSVSPRKDRGGRSPVRARIETNLKTGGNTIVKRKSLSIETGRRFNESSDSRRNSPTNSPKLTPKRSGSDQYSVTKRSPRSNRSNDMIHLKQKGSKNIVIEDESSSFSESSGSTTSYSDLERSKMEENRDGKSLLARCDKLLHSIAEMNSITTESQASFNSVIPSPISVLDSVFDKDESSSPSPVMQRSIDFKDLNVDLEDDIWRSIISPAATDEEFIISDDSDLTYITEIVRASKCLPNNSTVFFFLEKQKYLSSENSNNSSKHSKLRRKLLFDVVGEIIDKNHEQPPWKLSNDSIKQICYEFQKIREPETAEDLLDMICAVLKKDVARNNGWDDQTVEVSEAVLDIERLIFKDLVSETIRDLADFAGKTTLFAPRRKLVF